MKPAFPRASTYDLEWLFDTMMGPNVIWLAEWASQAVPLRKGMRILDLGCGKAASSIFLAKEFDVTVWAADLTDRVLPVHAEARALPIAEGYFDAILSFDAYHCFGTDDLYVGYVSKFVRPGGRLCIVAPGLTRELPEGPPEPLHPYWEWEFCSFHSPSWWHRHWSKTGLVEVERADSLAGGWQLWAEWSEGCAQAGVGVNKAAVAAREAELLRLDGGQTFAFTRVVARLPGG
jgi:SAM-dependent methyltransferase